MANRFIIPLLLIAVASLTHADNGLQVRLKTKAAKSLDASAVFVTVEFQNTADQTILINKAAVPNEALPDRLFTVTRDGVPVKYVGPVYKRAAPSADRTIALGPGKSISGSMSLSSAYNLSESGNYAVQYAVTGARVIFQSAAKSKTSTDAAGSVIQSNTLEVAVTARPISRKTSSAAAIEFSVCSIKQQSQLIAAKAVALTYSQNAYNYLVKTTKRTLPRYSTWFGSYSKTNWNKVKSDYLKITNAFKTVTIQFDCACTDEGIYAYVYIDDAYRIYLCGVFWATTLTGTDSRGGTLIHEMSHFTVVTGTDDHAYGQSRCQSLAIESPTKAINNADSHEYFAENTPKLA